MQLFYSSPSVRLGCPPPAPNRFGALPPDQHYLHGCCSLRTAFSSAGDQPADNSARLELGAGDVKPLLDDIDRLTRFAGRLKLREYQQEVAAAVVRSVVQGLGHSLAVMFPRQSGKNELQAQIEAYLLLLLKDYHAEMVKISPTWKPQSLNAMRRLERVLSRNMLTRGLWSKESGYIYRLGNARIFFLSGSPETNIVGATASVLLEVDEAQDIQIPKYDKDIAPMASSTNATCVFWGTAWTSRTLLARELRSAREAGQMDGMRRAFVITADDVSRELPSYGKFVAGQVTRLGRSHPLIRTQYYAEEIDSEAGMFPPDRRALMQGTHPVQQHPLPGSLYAILIDLAGEDEGASADPSSLNNPLRDLTALTVVEVLTAALQDPIIKAPAYHAVYRRQWIGVKHSELYGQLKAIIEHWNARSVVIDATGVGAGMASFLSKALGERVHPFTFSSAAKSRLGWDFLAVCDAGRWKEPAIAAGDHASLALQTEFWQQCEYCECRVLDGPGKLMRWGVPNGKRHRETGEILHDDLLISAALSAELDKHTWQASLPSVIVQAPDVLDDLDEGY